MSTDASTDPVLVHRQTGQAYPLGRALTTIGRQADNTIILADPQVSRHHARVSWQAGGFVIEDLGSANGTYVNEQLITGPRLLRSGYVVHLGNTVLDVHIPIARQDEAPPPMEGAAASPFAPASPPRQRLTLPIILGLIGGGFVVVCIVAALIFWLLDLRRAEPAVTIQSPVRGADLLAGSEILLHASATGARDIARLEVMVDGLLAASAASADDGGQPSLTATGKWTFQQTGSHIISAVAYTAKDRASGSTSITVNVAGTAASATLTPSSETPAIAPTSSVSPEATARITETVTPGPGTAVVTATPGTPAAETATPTATEPPQPDVEFFRADPGAITLGACAMLEWGLVSGASAVQIEPGIGGVGTPGSRQVCPTESTIYVLTATGAGGVTTATAAVTVGAPDLIVESVVFVPNPPVQGQDNKVQITIRNQGTESAAAFAWMFLPGTEPSLTGTVAGGLAAGASTSVTAEWRPNSSYANLMTTARADAGNVVAESDEENNELQVSVRVKEPSGPTTITVNSAPGLDGYVLSGGGVENGQDLRIGNFGVPADEQVYRSYLSYDLSAIPAGAIIQDVQVRFFQVQIVGDPYGHLGLFLMEHVDYGPSLDPGDYYLSASGQITVLAQATPGQWYTVNSGSLADWLRSDLGAGLNRFQLRLQFSIELDANSEADYAQFESGNGTLGSGNLPALTVTYIP